MENVSSVPIYLEDTEISAWSELSYNYLKPNPLKFFFFLSSTTVSCFRLLLGDINIVQSTNVILYRV